MNPEINEFNLLSTEPNNDLSIDLALFATSIKTLRENMTYIEFDNMIRDISKANDRGKLDEFLTNTELMYAQGTDLVSAFHFAMFDIIETQGENF